MFPKTTNSGGVAAIVLPAWFAYLGFIRDLHR